MIDGRTRHILDGFVHFMKGGRSFDNLFEDFTEDTNEWCPFTHGEFIDHDCYNNNPVVEMLISYLEKYILCNHFLDSNKYYVDEMNKILNELKKPQLVETHDNFERLLADIRELISALEPGIRKKLSGLTCGEWKD